MAKVIEFYIPARLRKEDGKWIPPKQHGKIISFPVHDQKSVWRRLGLGWPPVLLSNEYVPFRSQF